MYIRAKAESHRDYFGLLSLAVWKPEAVAEALPKTPQKPTSIQDRKEATKAAILRHDAWARGVNRRFERAEKAKAAAKVETHG